MKIFLIILAIYFIIGFVISIIIVKAEFDSTKKYTYKKTTKFQLLVLFLLSMIVYGWFFIKLFYQTITNGSKRKRF